ncbi:MAG: c-type cytochrome [Puniceicoccaceae bacterium]
MNETRNDHSNNQDLKVMEHSFDGIQEFDQKLPNWWLFTLYASIAFSVVYWVVRDQWMGGTYDYEKLETQLALVEDARMQETLAILDDDTLRSFADNETWVAAGRATYQQNCAACHMPDMSGMVGPSLVDAEWLHGSNPTDIYNVISNGVIEKGMQAWENQLGPKKIAEVVAYILSQQP